MTLRLTPFQAKKLGIAEKPKAKKARKKAATHGPWTPEDDGYRCDGCTMWVPAWWWRREWGEAHDE